MWFAPVRRVLAPAQLLLGAALALSPWVAGYGDAQTGAVHAWAAGSVVVLLALAALIAQWRAIAWAFGAVALWTMAAPWVFQFQAATPARWSHVGVGAALFAAAAADLAAARATPKTKGAA